MTTLYWWLFTPWQRLTCRVLRWHRWGVTISHGYALTFCRRCWDFQLEPPRGGGMMQIGQRVKLVAPSPLVRLRSPFGTIVREAEWAGYVVVRLDEPAIYLSCYGPEELAEIRERPASLEPAP